MWSGNCRCYSMLLLGRDGSIVCYSRVSLRMTSRAQTDKDLSSPTFLGPRSEKLHQPRTARCFLRVAVPPSEQATVASSATACIGVLCFEWVRLSDYLYVYNSCVCLVLRRGEARRNNGNAPCVLPLLMTAWNCGPVVLSPIQLARIARTFSATLHYRQTPRR